MKLSAIRSLSCPESQAEQPFASDDRIDNCFVFSETIIEYRGVDIMLHIRQSAPRHEDTKSNKLLATNGTDY